MNRTGKRYSAVTDRRSEGFSLVEMLVVISIIAILAALLIPVISKGIASGKSTSCISNLRELHLLGQTYANDYGKYPLMGKQVLDSDGNVKNISDENFYTFFGSELAAVCPAAKFKGSGSSGEPIKSYGSNPMVMNYSRSDSERKAVKPVQISRPMDVIFMADSAQFASGTVRVLPYSLAWWPHPENGNPARAEEPLTEAIIPETGFWDDIPLMPRRHLKKANLILVDGHTRSIKATGELMEQNYYWNY